MTEDPITFSELRKIQKEEDRQEDPTELGDDFVLRAEDYLEMKKNSGDRREYRNAKRVFDKIVSIREEKVVKKSRLAVKADVQTSTSTLLPREKELFRDLKKVFNSHRERMDDAVNSEVETEEVEEIDEAPEPRDEEKEPEEETEDSRPDTEEGYERVEIVSQVPEFMGTDLESYGPFSEGEEVEIPEENAEILVNRGSAEVVE